jgi:hypothetical protein
VEGTSVEDLVNALVSLYAIAKRHTKLRVEVKKAPSSIAEVAGGCN